MDLKIKNIVKVSLTAIYQYTIANIRMEYISFFLTILMITSYLQNNCDENIYIHKYVLHFRFEKIHT